LPPYGPCCCVICPHHTRCRANRQATGGGGIAAACLGLRKVTATGAGAWRQRRRQRPTGGGLDGGDVGLRAAQHTSAIGQTIHEDERPLLPHLAAVEPRQALHPVGQVTVRQAPGLYGTRGRCLREAAPQTARHCDARGAQSVKRSVGRQDEPARTERLLPVSKVLTRPSGVASAYRCSLHAEIRPA
jgi:hypothetical protein